MTREKTVELLTEWINRYLDYRRDREKVTNLLKNYGIKQQVTMDPNFSEDKLFWGMVHDVAREELGEKAADFIDEVWYNAEFKEDCIMYMDEYIFYAEDIFKRIAEKNL